VYLLHKQGKADRAFRIAEIELSSPKENEVLIEVEAFGLNYADVMARKGMYRETPTLPCTLGYEVLGKVIAVGSQTHASLLNKRVVAFTRFGAYAKHAITFVDALAEVGDEIDANTALALVVQGVTAYYMSSYISPIRENENVLIHAAAGGVGSLLIQMAKNAGATVIAKVSSDTKKQYCIDLGADYAINYKTHSYADEVTKCIGKQQLHVSYNPVGGSTFKEDRKLLGTASRLFLYGGSQLSEGKLGFVSQLNFLFKMGVIVPIFSSMQSKSFIGINVLRIADLQPKTLKKCLDAVITLYNEKRIQPQNGGTFQFNELVKAHQLLESGRSTGKIVVLN